MKTLFTTAALLAGTTLAAQAADLKICVEGAYPPFSETAEDGTVQGFDIDIANALCDEMGKECEMVKVDWDGIIPALLERKCDAIIASMSITEERKQVIDFTNKYYETPTQFVAATDSDIDFAGDLSGVSVGVQRGAIAQNAMEALHPQADLKLYATQDEAVLDLKSGRIDAVYADALTLSEGFLNTDQGEGFEFKGEPESTVEVHGEGIGIGLRQGEDELKSELNEAIATIRDNGTYDRLNDAYFEIDIYGEDENPNAAEPEKEGETDDNSMPGNSDAGNGTDDAAADESDAGSDDSDDDASSD